MSLWETVCGELQAFRGLMPLCVASWDRSWSPEVLKYDSCPEGFGSVSASRSLSEVAYHGRVRERSRFKKCADIAPRGHALRDLHPDSPLAICTPEPDPDQVSEDWELSRDFAEVPTKFLCDDPWKVDLNGPWVFQLRFILVRQGRR